MVLLSAKIVQMSGIEKQILFVFIPECRLSYLKIVQISGIEIKLQEILCCLIFYLTFAYKVNNESYMNNNAKTTILVASFLLAIGMLYPFSAWAEGQNHIINLAGKWHFAQGDVPSYEDQVDLPGSMLTNGKGDAVTVNTRWVSSLYDSSYYFNPYMEKYRVPGKMKFPFFLTPSKHYVGNAWYKRSVFVPKDWKHRRVVLFLERPHIETTVFVNGKEAGRDSSLSVPHEFDITPYVLWGKDNEITLKIYNGIEHVCVGQDSHSVTDQTQGDWNGVVGRMELQSKPMDYIKDLQVYPDVDNNRIRVRMVMADKRRRHDVQFFLLKSNGGAAEKLKGMRFLGDTLSVLLPMGDKVELWDEFNPHVYTLSVLMDGERTNVNFGMRKFTAEGRQIYINGRKTWIRGTVGNCCFPLTGYPPTDTASWIRIFKKCKEYGLNMMRFHSYCPPEAAFEAADQVGFYLQPEGPSWPNHGVKLGRGMTIDRYLLEETQRMVEKYGNHPSFCMLAAGNEPAGDWVKWVGDFVDYWKHTGDDRRLYCGASVGGGWAFDPKSEYHVKGGARGLDWGDRAPQSTDNYQSAIEQFVQKGKKPITFQIHEPYISHEQGQWCAFPDLDERPQYTGVYKPGNFDIFADLLRDNGMAGQAKKFLHASGKLQTLAYKYEVERNLRTKDYAGFQLLGINDYSGQGTALVGVLNVFWREKGYCTSHDWRQFCAPIVPLARFPKFVYANNEKFSVDIEMYNAYKKSLSQARTIYTISDEQNHVYAKGNLSLKDIPVDKNIPLGNVTMPLDTIGNPMKLTLTVSTTMVDKDYGYPISNSWDFWIYPSNVVLPQTKDIYITDTLDNKAQKTLERGGKVLLTAAGKVTLGSDVKQTYLPVFWNTSWFKMRPPHTTGVTIDKNHPMFRDFPTDDWGNLNWWELVNKAQVMNLRELPADYQSPVQPIDTWHVSRKLGMVVEANVLKGKLLITTMDISTDLAHRLVARQMRKSILDYMSNSEFHPALTLDLQTIRDFYEKQAPAVNMFTKDSPDELKPKLK